MYTGHMAQTPTQLDPESLVARIIAELQANPGAQQMLLRALLTQEFLGVPTRLERIEAEVSDLNRRASKIEIDVAHLRGDNLEFKLPRRIRPLISQRLGLRRARIMQSLLVADSVAELSDSVDDAYESGLLTSDQETRLDATDLILRAQSKTEGDPVWVAVEASATISGHDIERARQSADALGIVFGGSPVAAVVGYAIKAEDEHYAAVADVEVFVVAPDS